ncbi:MAG: peptidylprolyl isomerase [Nitrospirae bacterium]|nr:peptidylprolyl isomerase [Nitrospirota bacterium]
MKKLLVVMVVMNVVIFASGCAPKKEEPVVLAVVNDTKITKEEFLSEMEALPDFARGMFENKEGKERFLDEMIKREILYQEAKKKGLEKDKDFQKKLEEFKKINLVSMILKTEIQDKVKVDEKDIKDFFEKHSEEFKARVEVRASHILVKTEDEAKKLLEKIKKGENFAKLAKEFSLDAESAKNGGDVGFFSKGQMIPEFEKAAFALKAGEVSSPVKTQFGYHLIKVTDRKTGKAVEFEQVKGVIERRLTAERQKSLFDSYIEGLKKTSKITVKKEALEALMQEQKTPEQKDKPQGQSKGKP